MKYNYLHKQKYEMHTDEQKLTLANLTLGTVVTSEGRMTPPGRDMLT
jgi:hypothetical protein